MVLSIYFNIQKNHEFLFESHGPIGCGGGTRTTRPSGYEPDKLPTAPLRDIKNCLVLMAGLEPARILLRRILSPLRLPIPPHEQINSHLSILRDTIDFVNYLFLMLFSRNIPHGYPQGNWLRRRDSNHATSGL